MKSGKTIIADLCGVFRIVTEDGRIITPRAAKAQAMLALLLTEPNMTRTRKWLQDKLWSDRGKKQGQESVRQSLQQIRRAFGDLSDILITVENQHTVSLDRDRVMIAPCQDRQFLEGLDVGGSRGWPAC